MVNLITLIKEKKAKVAVIGLGYVGLPTAVGIAKAGYKVFGIDVKNQRVDSVNKGKSYIFDVPSKELKKVTKTKKLILLKTMKEIVKMRGRLLAILNKKKNLIGS